MSDCPLQFLREEPGERRPFIHRCPVCGTEVRSKYRDPAMHHRTCGSAEATPATIEGRLTAKERTTLESAAAPTGKLLGDWIADLTTAVGIPPCGGCEKRKAWLNAAHAWLLGKRVDVG